MEKVLLEQMQQVLNCFQHIQLRNWDICHTVGPMFISCVVEVYRLGLEPLCDTHLHLSVILKTLTLTGQEFLEVKEKTEITGHEVRTIGWMIIKHLPAELLQEMCCLSCCVWPWTWPSWLISIDAVLCAFKNFITDRTSQSAGAGIRASIFNRNNDAIVRAREVPRHVTSLLYHIHAVASSNKWFTSCGTSEKHTLWTSLVNDLPTRTKRRPRIDSRRKQELTIWIPNITNPNDKVPKAGRRPI